MRSLTRSLSALGAALTLAFVFADSPSASAATFNVNNLGDTADAAPGNGVCATAPGHCTLRAAVEEANALAGPDAVNIAVAGTINLTGALPDLLGELTVNGLGANFSTVRRSTGDSYRVFTVAAGANVTLSGLTITNGRTPDGVGLGDELNNRGNSGGDGGGVWNAGTLTLLACSVNGNQTGEGATGPSFFGGRGGDGGGVFNSGTMTVASCNVRNNRTGNGGAETGQGGRGGGLFNSGALRVINSAVIGNATGRGGLVSSLFGGRGGDGGGIYNDAGTLLVAGSLVNNNVTGDGTRGSTTTTIRTTGGDGGAGGGIYVGSGAFEMVGGTIGSNRTGNGAERGGWGGTGGGLNVELGTATLTNVTIRDNLTGSGNINVPIVPPPVGGGGGISNFNVMTLTGCTVSGNSTQEGTYGGGLGAGIDNEGTLTMTNSTVSGNVSDFALGGIYSFGLLFMSSCTVVGNSGWGVNNQSDATLGNTILNSASGIFNSQGYNFIGDGDAASGFVATDKVGTQAAPLDPQLGPLAANGGPTQTHLPLAPGAVIDKGLSALAVDQRGLPRPVDLPGFANSAGGNAADIGAVEVQPAGRPQLLISEFRLRGPGGTRDEFVEIYNNSDAAHTVGAPDTSGGYALAASDGAVRFTIPNGTVIPARGHFLGVNSVGYSLGSHPAGVGTTATANAMYTVDIPDNAGLALFRTANPAGFNPSNRLDAVGPTSEANALYREGAGYPALTSTVSINHSLYRNLSAVTPRDTDDNNADFVFVAVGGTGILSQSLGAPGPENLSAPIQRGSVSAALLDPCVGGSSPPNRLRDLTSDPANNSNSGTLSILRTFTNNTGVAVTRLRFRVTELTTFPAPPGTADLRPRTSGDVVLTVDRAPCGSGTTNVTARGTTLEQPPAQPNGGGLNSSMSLVLSAPLAPGASLDVRFLLGLQQTGSFRFFINVEALP